jgi:hypothetical protein
MVGRKIHSKTEEKLQHHNGDPDWFLTDENNIPTVV